MPPFPNSFPPKRELIETFDFKDIASGSGFENFYGIKDIGSGDYKLIVTTPDVGYTHVGTNEPINSGGTQNRDTTMNFDTSTFNLPRTINGNPFVIFSLAGIDGDSTTLANIQLKIVHSDDSTTDITTDITLAEIGLNTENFNTAIFVDLGSVSKIGIKKGEKIRLTFDPTMEGEAWILHNPSGSSFTLVDIGGTLVVNRTQMILGIPFRIES